MSLFIVVFAGIAVWLWMIPISIGIRAIKLRNAVLVDSQILDIDRQRVKRGDGSGELVTVRYEYNYLGKRYEHNTHEIALFHTGTTANWLEESLSAGHAVQCFVDPDDPTLSIFSKEFSIGWFIFIVLIASAFGGVSIISQGELYRRARESIRLKRLTKGKSS